MENSDIPQRVPLIYSLILLQSNARTQRRQLIYSLRVASDEIYNERPSQTDIHCSSASRTSLSYQTRLLHPSPSLLPKWRLAALLLYIMSKVPPSWNDDQRSKKELETLPSGEKRQIRSHITGQPQLQQHPQPQFYHIMQRTTWQQGWIDRNTKNLHFWYIFTDFSDKFPFTVGKLMLPFTFKLFLIALFHWKTLSSSWIYKTRQEADRLLPFPQLVILLFFEQ